MGTETLTSDPCSAYQVKPLLQVTRQDEEIQVREAELQKANDKLTRVEQDFNELDKKHIQVNKPLPCSPYIEIPLL